MKCDTWEILKKHMSQNSSYVLKKHIYSAATIY